MCVCVFMCMWQRAPEILCCVQGTHAGSPKVPLCACPDYALRIGNVANVKMCQCVRRASRACEADFIVWFTHFARSMHSG